MALAAGTCRMGAALCTGLGSPDFILEATRMAGIFSSCFPGAFPSAAARQAAGGERGKDELGKPPGESSGAYHRDGRRKRSAYGTFRLSASLPPAVPLPCFCCLPAPFFRGILSCKQGLSLHHPSAPPSPRRSGTCCRPHGIASLRRLSSALAKKQM